MTTFYVFDSTYRDVDAFPLPSYFVFSQQTDWVSIRTATCIPKKAQRSICNVSYSTELIFATVPTAIEIPDPDNPGVSIPMLTWLERQSYFYITLSNVDNRQNNLICSMGGAAGLKVKNVTFSVYLDKVFSNFAILKTSEKQVIDIDIKKPLIVSITDKEGTPIPLLPEVKGVRLNPLNQVSYHFSTTPFVIDNFYKNENKQVRDYSS